MDGESERSDYFKAFFRAYHRQCAYGLGYQYSTLPNLIVVPSGYDAAAGLFEHLHEQGHAQLTNTVLGLSVHLLEKLAGKVQEAVFFRLGTILKLLETSDPQLRRDLFFFGKPVDWAGSSVPEDARRAYASFKADASFTEDVALFRLLNRRVRAISERWRPVQEGMAILNGCAVATRTSDLAVPFLRQAVSMLPPEARTPSARRLLRGRLRVLAAETEGRHATLSSGASDSTKGYLLAREALDRCGQMSRVWFMALIASHFPYHRCRLVDMEDAEFDRIVTHGYLNPWNRFAALIGRADEVVQALGDPGRIPAILSDLAPEHSLEPLTPDAWSFGRWKRDFFWGSERFTRFIGVPVNDQLAPHLRHHLDLHDEDRRNDVRMWARNEPNVVDEDGNVRSENGELRAAFESNFIHWYEIYRTETLLNSLDSFAK